MSDSILLIGFFTLLSVALLGVFLYRRQNNNTDGVSLLVERYLNQQLSSLQDKLHSHNLTHSEQLQGVQDKLSSALQHSLGITQDLMARRLNDLNSTSEQRMQHLSAYVHKTLDDGFSKSGGTLEQITQRLATIDEAQRKISDLSQGILQLQDILWDKRARGAFGELQLSVILEDALPKGCFDLQHSLPNGTRVDCLLRLPAPCGPIAIDAKFPLENYRRSIDSTLAETERQQASSLFKQDLKKHLNAIKDKYILHPHTADAAILFLPSEAVFAEIHSQHPDIVQLSHQLQVWIASPSTLMAILTTVKAVFRDITLREEAEKIRHELQQLGLEFGRFDERVDKLQKHYKATLEGFDELMITGKKIVKQFKQISQDA